MVTFLYLTWQLWHLVNGAPIPTPDVDGVGNPSSSQPPSSALFYPGSKADTAFLWTSIGLAVLTAFFQGLVSALAYMTEASNMWTFRFRLAKVEHWWWTIVTILLAISLTFDVLSFASGNTTNAVSILLLSSTTLITLVRYMLPAWRGRKYIENRWLSWTGPSRTAVRRNAMTYCGGIQDWNKQARRYNQSKGKAVPSDAYGWYLWPVNGIRQDPTDILNIVNSTMLPELSKTEYVFNDGDDSSENVSLFWGQHSGFLPRVSRSISAMPMDLLKSQPITSDGFAGEGFCLGMGILGRNKGLDPKTLVFKMTSKISTSLENKSAWRPRPAKTLRSYYRKTLDIVYGGISEQFVLAAVELCLILMDADEHAVKEWLKATCEQQSYRINQTLVKYGATPAELSAHYRSSYVSMIISLNNMKDKQLGHRNHGTSQAKRPDIICLALLLKAEGASEPTWWNKPEIDSYRAAEKQHLDSDWYDAAAQLLGLETVPHGLENGIWESSKQNTTQRENSPSTEGKSEATVEPNPLPNGGDERASKKDN